MLKTVVGTENTANEYQTKCGHVNFDFGQIKITVTYPTGQVSK